MLGLTYEEIENYKKVSAVVRSSFLIELKSEEEVETLKNRLDLVAKNQNKKINVFEIPKGKKALVTVTKEKIDLFLYSDFQNTLRVSLIDLDFFLKSSHKIILFKETMSSYDDRPMSLKNLFHDVGLTAVIR